MGLFHKKTREERLEEERQAMINAGWISPEEDMKLWEELKEYEKMYDAPKTPVMIGVDNDTEVIQRGYYKAWCYQGNIVFAHVLSSDKAERASFPYDTVKENFTTIPATSFVSVEIEGERIEHTEIKGAKITGRRNIDLKTKKVVNDNRKGIAIIKNGNSQCHVKIPYFDVSKLKGLVDGAKQEKTLQDGGKNSMDILIELKKLMDTGVLTQEEFDAKKAEVLKRI